MLVLTVKPEDGIVLRDRVSGDLIAKVMIARVRGDKVRLGIEADWEVSVRRFDIDNGFEVLDSDAPTDPAPALVAAETGVE